ncbi:MAG: hypothetical protein OEU36_03525 [Gammaproteobacteria bacterium]|nr:hypothetical protein [Gammaproteobacteria bacterium]
MNEIVAGAIGMIIVSAFLLGLASSIDHTPFWGIVLCVLPMGWFAWWQETIRHRSEY